MNMDEAARDTRKYKMSFIYGCGKGPSGIAVCMEGEDDDYIKMFSGTAEAQTACDYLNLLAVLDAIREPTGTLINKAANTLIGRECFGPNLDLVSFYAMIDTMIADIKKEVKTFDI